MSKNPEAKEKAIALRKEGLSPREIGERLGFTRGVIYHWVRHVELTEAQKAHLCSMSYGSRSSHLASLKMQANFREVREAARAEGRAFAKKGDVNHAMACALYWAEGTKKKNSVCLANTDPEMIRFFYSFLVRVFQATPAVMFSYHQDEGNAPEKEAKAFWAKLLGLKEKDIKSFANKDKRPRTGLKKKRHRNGMCIVSLHSTPAVQHIYGALEVYSGVAILPESCGSGPEVGHHIAIVD